MVVAITTAAQKSVSFLSASCEMVSDNLHTYVEVINTGRTDVETQKNYVPAFIKGGNIIPVAGKAEEKLEFDEKRPVYTGGGTGKRPCGDWETVCG